MATIGPKKVLLVEGNTEKRFVPELMEQRGVIWEPEPKKYVVDIKVAGGLVTAPDLLKTFLKESALTVFGVVFDADGMRSAGENRWAAMRSRCEGIGIDLPDPAPMGGYITTLPSGIRFGIWMMPDNKPPGMLETFLLSLLKPEEVAGPLFRYARDAVTKAHSLNAPFKNAHQDKALIHTWLAWQNEPGPQLHQAIIYKMLDAVSPNADAFVTWFRTLFVL